VLRETKYCSGAEISEMSVNEKFEEAQSISPTEKFPEMKNRTKKLSKKPKAGNKKILISQ